MHSKQRKMITRIQFEDGLYRDKHGYVKEIGLVIRPRYCRQLSYRTEDLFELSTLLPAIKRV